MGGRDRHHASWYVTEPELRRRAKIDGNHAQLVKQLREIPGVTVLSLAPIGNGCPDALIGYAGRNFLLEFKDPSKPPSKRNLTDDQAAFFLSWGGHVAKVETLAEALVELSCGEHQTGRASHRC